MTYNQQQFSLGFLISYLSFFSFRPYLESNAEFIKALFEQISVPSLRKASSILIPSLAEVSINAILYLLA